MKEHVEKDRLDNLLLALGEFDSREKAKAAIMAGIVFVNGNREDKAGSKFPVNADIVIKGKKNPYVSRGGYKLEKAIKEFDLELNDVVAMDVGASTGGFTDCMLQNGASKVFAVDVGTNQLAYKLRVDERVVCLEQTNAKNLDHSIITEPVSFVSIDVAFISLTKILTAVRGVMAEDGQITALIKPQFEAGKEQVGKKGIVRDPLVHREVIEKILLYSQSIGFEILGLTFSPIKGPAGNIEYLALMKKNDKEFPEFDLNTVVDVVNSAHDLLD